MEPLISEFEFEVFILKPFPSKTNYFHRFNEGNKPLRQMNRRMNVKNLQQNIIISNFTITIIL